MAVARNDSSRAVIRERLADQPLPHTMSRFAGISLLVLLAVSSGCPGPGSTPKPASESSGEPSVAEVPTAGPAAAATLPADDAEAIAALEALGVKLERDAEGRVVGVNASEISGELTDEEAGRLPGLPGLARVNLDYTLVSNEGLARLAEMPSIKSLSLRRCANINDAGLVHLVKLPQLEQLHLLYNSNSITDAGMEAVGQITSLRVLDLRGCTQIGNAGLKHLQGLTNLIDLKLQCPPVSDEGLASLAGLTRLRNLALEKTRVTSAGLAALESMHELQGLNLYSTPVDDAGLVHLQGLTKLRDVKLRDTAAVGTGLIHLHPSKETMWRLDLSETFVTDEGLAHVAALENLESLNLWYAGVTDAGLPHLAGLKRLKELNLEECDVSDEGLGVLAGLGALESLNLANTKVTDDGLEALHALQALKSLNLSNTQVSEEAVDAFRAAVPGCEVTQ